ncbi:MAG: multiheme c-type cytochrome [Nevskia sp.]|nr:multiheme c-type cytochrome [Nevskia sp.]
MRKTIVRLVAVVLLPWAAAGSAADAGKHLGVASCAGSTCHGSTRPFTDSRIRQDEYFTWQRKDAHTRAYDTLLSERSQEIAHKLALKDAANAPRCLVCHAENAPQAQRGERYMVTDGIGCEACHGGSEHWIREHTAGYKTLADRSAAGLYPTWDPIARARLCSGCHVGDNDHPMSHAIMAAGHPPILFELDTFEVLEPPHWRVDAGYVERKGPQDPARNWAAGQVEGARAVLENLAGPRFHGGAFPELAFFDCNACHHSLIKGGRARPQRSGGLPDGSVPLADSQLVMLIRWLDVVEPAAGRKWHDQWVALQAASQRSSGEVQSQARNMLVTLDSVLVPKVRATTLDDAQLRSLLKSIVAEARGSHAGDFSNAEQTAMAVSVLTTALSERGAEQVSDGLRKAVDGLYAQVMDRDRFQPDSYRGSVEKVAVALGLARGAAD